MRLFTLLTSAALFALSPLASALAADEPLHLSIKDHHFVPERLVVPAGVKFKLLVKNEDTTPEEFESVELRREKLVPPGDEVVVFLGPLDAGDYKIFGDFHQDVTQGVIVAK